jgi:very-short-patch-repair endonuclease
MTAFYGVEAADKTGEDTNSNGSDALTPEPAGYPIGGWLVNAGVGRIVTSERSQCRGLSFGFQAPIRVRTNLQRYFPVFARHQRGDDMTSSEPEDFIEMFADWAANARRRGYLSEFEKFSARCESPIERVMAGAMIYTFNHSAPEGNDKVFFSHLDYEWPDCRIFHYGNGGAVYAQAVVGPYRVDFLVQIRWEDRLKFIVVECDGHEFHERTKEQAERDRFRDRWMLAHDILVLRFTGSEIWRDSAARANEVVSLFFDVASSLWAETPLDADIQAELERAALEAEEDA